MDTGDNIALPTEFEAAGIAAMLEKWYADHSSIRRLWAIADPIALKVLVALEPTFDGDETLPVWLAHSRVWVDELRLHARREVHLQLVASGPVGMSHVDADAVKIAEIGWRDC